MCVFGEEWLGIEYCGGFFFVVQVVNYQVDEDYDDCQLDQYEDGVEIGDQVYVFDVDEGYDQYEYYYLDLWGDFGE